MEGSQSVLVWWAMLSIIALFNVFLLIFSYRRYTSKKKGLSTEVIKFRNWQFYLATIYTLGCGFRSILPRGDVRRIVLVDHWISAIAIGRTVATIAELSFIIQLSLMLYEAGKFTGNKTMQNLAKLPFPIIIVAETFSWYACTTGNFMGTIIEESLWAFSASLILIGLIIGKKYYIKNQLKFIYAAIVGCTFYIIYMIKVDISEYVRKWQASEAEGKIYSSIKQGLHEVATQWTYTRAYEDWKYEFVWMTLYFSLAVWLSIYLMNAPTMDKNIKPMNSG